MSSPNVKAPCPTCGAPLPEHRIVIRNSKVAQLTRREYQIFDRLNKTPYHTVTRAQLLDHLYGLENEEPEWRILMVLIHHARNKLAPLGIEIVNVWNEGYLLKFSEV
jgi:DNA-binding response OmpR family regulator